MSELSLENEIIESKDLIKKIRWDLLNLLSQRENEDEGYLNLVNEYSKIIDKINSNLNVLKRNWLTLEGYIIDFNEMNSNSDYLKIYNLKGVQGESDAERAIKNFLKNSFGDFNELNILIFLDDFDIGALSKENLNIYSKLQYDLEYIVQNTKETIIQFKNIADNYRNNIKMIPVFEASRKTIENNLLKYIDDKKSEIDRHFKSLQDEIKSVRSNFKILDEEVDGLKEANSLIKEDNNKIDKKMLEITNGIIGLEKTYIENKLDLDQKLDNEVNAIRKDTYSLFESRLVELNKELDEVDVLINNEINSVKDTSQSFKDFISDETSIKLTDDYKSKANWEMWSYYLYNALSFIIIGTAIYLSWNSLSVFAEAHIGDKKSYDGYDLAYLSIRLIFSLLVFSSVAFTSRLASKSYVYWKKNEGIFLRLTALKSFIADMSESKKEEIHEKLVDVYFGKDEQDQNLNQKLKDLPNNITQLLGKVVDQTSVVLDASKPKRDTQPPAGGQSGG